MVLHGQTGGEYGNRTRQWLLARQPRPRCLSLPERQNLVAVLPAAPGFHDPDTLPRSLDRGSCSGPVENRTPDLLRATQALSRLSYEPNAAISDAANGKIVFLCRRTPTCEVGVAGVEPAASCLSSRHSASELHARQWTTLESNQDRAVIMPPALPLS